MALQGSIDTFALDDVLRLVAGTGKTGRFSLRGPRGEGVLVVRDGQVLHGAVSTDERASELPELVFELLRFDEGDFAFDAEPVDGYDEGEAADVEDLIAEAAGLLDEWRAIEQVVPGHQAVVTLDPDGLDGEVTITPGDWRVIAAIGSGATVEELSHRLDASQLTTGRMLRPLVEMGLLGAELDGTSLLAGRTEPDAGSWDDEAAQYVTFSAEPEAFEAPIDGNGNGNGHGAVDAEVLFESVHEYSVATVEVPDGDELAADEVPGVDAAEFARQLAELPPQAARAVAAAARATSAEEREAALAELDGTGEDIDHEQLLALLGPVEG